MAIVEVKNLTKDYGEIRAVNGISFDIEEGEIFGLIGPNGAGKTTTLRIVSTILRKSYGEITIGGMTVGKDDDKIRQIISYLPEEAGAYKTLTGLGYLDFMAGFYAESPSQKKQFIERGIEIASLGERLRNKVSTYSKGMARKLLLARALMIMPRLAILDEPTSGLDVMNSIEIRNLIKSYAKEGVTVLLSSHNMLEIEFLSNRVALIDHGNILDIGTPQFLKERYSAQNLEDVFVEALR
ncbi:MAG: ABC transporter ATP-binding protein [Caldisericaceae bacterium]